MSKLVYSENMVERLLSNQNLDTELWEKFKEGDREAFRTIYQKYLDELFNYGCKITPVRGIATDCIQEMFIDIWQKKSNLSKTDNVKFYLFKALRRRIVKELSRDRKYLTGYDHSALENTMIVLPAENKIIENQESADKLKKLKKAINKLSDRQREIVSLIFYEGFSYEEISNLLGINLRSTYTLAWKALASLRKEIVKFILIPFFLQ